MDTSATKIRPLFRPFVIRPTVWMSAVSLVLTLAYFVVWDDLYLVIGNAAWAGPALLLALPFLLLAARIIAHRGTHYSIDTDRIVIHRGGVFGDRSVELDLVNITLVEWRSPFLLKSLYGVGHIVIQEAGNAAQNARLVYIENPQAIYRLIAQNMRQQGFSMQRNARVCREKSGMLGAAVDMLGFSVGLAYTIFITANTLAFSFGQIAANIASSLSPLVNNTAAHVENIEYIVGLIVVLLSGFVLLGAIVWMICKFVELSRRTLTLYDDVVDYYQGFLSEKRQFIPLENLTDTELLRPLYKRILGLSDLRVSSRGAGSNLAFNSMPGAEGFAAALETRLDKMTALKSPATAKQSPTIAGSDGAAPDTYQTATRTAPPTNRPPSRTYTFKPEIWRAASGSILKFLLFPLLIFAGMGLFAALGASGVEHLGEFGAGIFGAIAIWGGIWLVSTLFSVGRSILYARATEYSFDGRRARKTFDFINREETKFAIDQVTSFSILTDPIDRVLGTMTLRLRSIGSAKSLDFKYIENDPSLISGLEKALGFKQATPPAERQSATRLTPKFTLIEGIKAHIVGFLATGATLLGPVILIALAANAEMIAAGVYLGASFIAMSVYILWQYLRVGRLKATLDATTVTVEGGVLRHFRHHTAFHHIKGVDSVQYPASSFGKINISTGGGFTMSIDFLGAIRTHHDRLDSRILGQRVGSSDPIEFRPNTPTAAMRHFGRLAILIVPILTMPFSLPWVIWRNRRTRYRIEKDRIFIEIPLIFHHRTSVLYKRIDHLESSRNLANKIFKTRDIEVYTVGSSTVDLALHGLTKHEEALGIIRGRSAA